MEGERMSDERIIQDTVKEKYGAAARRALDGEQATCCGSAGCGCDPVSSNLYDPAEAAGLPEGAVLASLGCGNPTALAELHEGETVLDLGSGGGIDVLLSAKRVAPTGKAYGLDMTDEMLALARKNQVQAGIANAEVIISNCVINLSADKGRVLREAFRVLKRGGRFAVSDVVVRGEVPAAVRRSMELWVGCVAGALDEKTYKQLLAAAGFVDVAIEPTRIYEFDDARAVLSGAGLDAEVLAREAGGRIMGAFVRARKPA
jgi:SAM-dependent methyltransferase